MRQSGGASRIDAGVLIPGAGAPLAAATVLTDGGTISYAGPTAALGPGAPARTDVHVPVVMPGMWDCHCHLYGVCRFSLEEMLITRVPTAAARAAMDAEAALQAGFTSLREAGGIGIWLVPAVEEGTINGPSIYSAGSVLSQTGGHADVHTLPAGWVAGACEDGRFLHLCDSVRGPLAVTASIAASGDPRSGQLRPGYDADLLALSRNPVEDLTVLADPKEITHVWKWGPLVKHPVAP